MLDFSLLIDYAILSGKLRCDANVVFPVRVKKVQLSDSTLVTRSPVRPQKRTNNPTVRLLTCMIVDWLWVCMQCAKLFSFSSYRVKVSSLQLVILMSSIVSAHPLHLRLITHHPGTLITGWCCQYLGTNQPLVSM